MRVTLERRAPYLMVLPISFLMVIFISFLVYVVVMSLTNSTLAKPFNAFVGLDNYANALRDETFGLSLVNTFVFAFVVTTIETLLGFILAFAIVSEVRAGKFLRTLALIPLFTPPVAVAMIWRLIYDPISGFLNYYLLRLGLIDRPIALLGNTATAMPAIMVADIWQWTPFTFLLCLAALSSLPSEPYEAAAVDGASGWQVFWRLTLPMVLPAVIVVYIFRLLIALKVFDLVFILTYGGPGSATQVASFYIYRIAFTQFKIGYAAALTMIVLIIVSLVTTVFTTGREIIMKRSQ